MGGQQWVGALEIRPGGQDDGVPASRADRGAAQGAEGEAEEWASHAQVYTEK
jgi:hypothetical protein